MIRTNSLQRKIIAEHPDYEYKQSFKHTRYRYIALILACFTMLGDSYCFDNPMALQSQIQDVFLIDNFKFNLLYSLYSFPNIILPFFAGIIVDRIGTRKAIFYFSLLLIFGQTLCIIGSYQVQYILLVIGRIIFGMGSESLNTAQNSIMAHWFFGKEISLALGLCISIPKLGSALNSIISPTIASVGTNDKIGDAMIVGGFFLLFSFVCGLILIYMDSENDKREQYQQMVIRNFLLQNKQRSNQKSSFHCPQKQYESEKSEENKVIENIDSSSSNNSSSSTEEKLENINFRDISRMSGTFWILSIICMLTEALFVPFLDNANDFFQERFKLSPKTAGEFLILPYLISAVLTPIIGIYVDQIGQRALFIIITAQTFLVTHLLLLTLKCDSICFQASLPLFFLGLCYSMYSSIIIPSIPLVVKRSLVGTAFGVVAVFQNVALTIFPLITGQIFENFNQEESNKGYIFQSYFFIGVSVFNLIISISLFLFDRWARNPYLGVKKTIVVNS